MFSAGFGRARLSATMSIVLTALAGIGILVGQRVNVTFGGIGIGCWAIVLAYVLGGAAGLLRPANRHRTRDRTRPGGARAGRQTLAPDGGDRLLRRRRGDRAGRPVAAQASGKLAELSGLGDTFFGTTLVALCTSLPELVATVTAVRMGAFDLCWATSSAATPST